MTGAINQLIRLPEIITLFLSRSTDADTAGGTNNWRLKLPAQKEVRPKFFLNRGSECRTAIPSKTSSQVPSWSLGRLRAFACDRSSVEKTDSGGSGPRRPPELLFRRGELMTNSSVSVCDSIFLPPEQTRNTDFDLPYWRHRDGIHLVLWCKLCRVYHRHGAGGGDGARTEHCWNPNSGYKGAGYVLKTDLGVFPPELERDAKRRRPLGPEAVR